MGITKVVRDYHVPVTSGANSFAFLPDERHQLTNKSEILNSG